MTNQVLSVGQMQHLKELGLEMKDTMLYWIVYKVGNEKNFVTTRENAMEVIDESCGMLPAYTLQDVLDLLPKQIGVEYIYDLCIFPESISYTQFIGGEINDNLFEVPINESLIDAASSILCWAIENGYVETIKTNEL